jgi:hypothetical protein
VCCKISNASTTTTKLRALTIYYLRDSLVSSNVPSDTIAAACVSPGEGERKDDQGDDIQEAVESAGTVVTAKDETVASAAVPEPEPECEEAESRNLPAAEQTTTTAALIFFEDVPPSKSEDHTAAEDGGGSDDDCNVFCCTIL